MDKRLIKANELAAVMMEMHATAQREGAASAAVNARKLRHKATAEWATLVGELVGQLGIEAGLDPSLLHDFLRSAVLSLNGRPTPAATEHQPPASDQVNRVNQLSRVVQELSLAWDKGEAGVGKRLHRAKVDHDRLMFAVLLDLATKAGLSDVESFLHLSVTRNYR
jgi:hypothetical protein